MFGNCIRAFKHVLQVKAFTALKQRLILKRQKDVARQIYPFNLQKKCLESLWAYFTTRKSLAAKKALVEKTTKRT